MRGLFAFCLRPQTTSPPGTGGYRPSDLYFQQQNVQGLDHGDALDRSISNPTFEGRDADAWQGSPLHHRQHMQVSMHDSLADVNEAVWHGKLS